MNLLITIADGRFTASTVSEAFNLVKAKFAWPVEFRCVDAREYHYAVMKGGENVGDIRLDGPNPTAEEMRNDWED